MSQVAFVDESYIDRTAHYLLAAAVLPEDELLDARLAIAQLRRQHGAAFHWHDEHELARLAMLGAALADTTTRAIVVAQPVPEHRQERARATCMANLLAHLQTLEPPVARVVFESRTKALNRRDADRIEGLRSSRHLVEAVRYSFETKSEPLLAFADALAGAASAHLTGDTTYAAGLGAEVTWIYLPGVA